MHVTKAARYVSGTFSYPLAIESPGFSWTDGHLELKATFPSLLCRSAWLYDGCKWSPVQFPGTGIFLSWR